MGLVEVEILLCVPEGEELTDERIEALTGLGFSDDCLMQRRAGRVAIVFLTPAATWEAEAEARAEEILEEMSDADLVDISLTS